MTYKQISLNSSPNQSFVVSLTINGISRNLSFFQQYSSIAGYWLLNIGDEDTGETLLSSVPLVPGNYPSANILSQYAYLRIGKAIILNIAGTDEQYPGVDTISTDWALIWSDND